MMRGGWRGGGGGVWGGCVFFFNDTATTEIYTLSLHDALPIWDTFFDCRCLLGGLRLHAMERQDEGRR